MCKIYYPIYWAADSIETIIEIWPHSMTNLANLFFNNTFFPLLSGYTNFVTPDYTFLEVNLSHNLYHIRCENVIQRKNTNNDTKKKRMKAS